MRRGLLHWAAILVVAGLAFPAHTIGQVDEAELAEALELLGQQLGLGPVEPAELKATVESVGELRFGRNVPIDFMSREGLEHYLRELFDEEYPRDFASREERMLRAFGFLDEGQDLRRIREKVLHENVAGFYDERPGVKQLFAISSGRSLNVQNQLILSHELRHALQDQQVTIRDKLEVESDYDDRRLAVLCLFEGDASILMQQYLIARVTRNAPQAAGLFQIFSQSMTGEEIASMFAGPALQDAPAVVQEQLIAPYFQGQRLALEIFEKGGFPLLNEKLHEPPRSMEQVLHPEKYLDDVDEPTEVRLPEARGQAADFEGRLGEFLVGVLLREGPRPGVANEAAAGWDGDRYAVLPTESGYRLVWRSVWDSTKDAREFESAFRAYADARFGEDEYELELAGTEVYFERRGFE